MYSIYQSILDKLYEFFSEYYLWTSMLSTPYYYSELVNNRKDEIIKISFLSAIYDFQIRVSAIRSRFYFLIELMSDNKYRIDDLTDRDVFDELMSKVRERYGFFHRFDPDGRIFYYVLKILDDIDWEHILLHQNNTEIDKAVVRELTRKAKGIMKHIEDTYIRGSIWRILPKNPNGVNKRINLFLRWMVRDEYPDLGLWSKYVDKSMLLIPMGTEISRTAGRIFYGKEIGISRRNAIKITRILKQLRPHDPIKYDFVLSRPAILGICNKDLRTSYCEVCPLRNLCRTYMNSGRKGRKYRFSGKKSKKKHDQIIRSIWPRLKQYISEYGVVCQFDRSINHDLRPDIFCNYSSRNVIIGEVKPSTHDKYAPLQLKQYLDELLKEYHDREYIGLLVFGKYDPIELKHIIELIDLLRLNEKFRYINIVIAPSGKKSKKKD